MKGFDDTSGRHAVERLGQVAFCMPQAEYRTDFTQNSESILRGCVPLSAIYCRIPAIICSNPALFQPPVCSRAERDEHIVLLTLRREVEHRTAKFVRRVNQSCCLPGSIVGRTASPLFSALSPASAESPAAAGSAASITSIPTSVLKLPAYIPPPRD